jgi:hypothetical protein
MKHWRIQLKPILVQKIEEAINKTDDILGKADSKKLFPWLGDNCYEILADAAINVLVGMEDMEKYLKDNGMLE